MARPQPAPTQLPENLVAICLDTNCMGEGRVRLTPIEELSELIEDQQLSVEIWVPEPVVWEWAEHVYRQFEDARARYILAWDMINNTGLDAPDDLKSQGPAGAEDVVRHLSQSLADIYRVRILMLDEHPTISRLALKDQTLQVGVGRRKSSVKAGAADSASFRLLDAAMRSVPGRASAALVSGDQDAAIYFKDRRDVVLPPSLWAAKRSIVTMRTGSEIAEDQIKEAALDTLPTMGRHELRDASIEGSPDLKTGSRLRGREVAKAITVHEIDVVLAVESVDVSFSDGYGTALVDALVSVERELQVLSAINDELEFDVETFDGVPATLQISAMRGSGTYWSIEVEQVIFY